MKTNRIMDEIRSTLSPEMKLQMDMSLAIANRIYEILEAKGMSQKDLAHVENNMDENARHSYRQKQLAGILVILNDYKTHNTISWSSIRSWVSNFIALFSQLYTLCR